MSYSNYLEDKINDAVCNNVALQVAQAYIKLHTGDPGEDGTSNAAGNTSRQSVSFGASSGGTCTSDANVVWASVSTSETYSHISMWDASTAGNCLGSGALTVPTAVTAGDTFTLASGNVTFTSG